MISVERVREVLDYDPETGLCTWRVATGNRAAVGRRAGSRTGGYRQIEIDSCNRLEHHIAWAWMTGEWPPAGVEVDHRNEVKDDNRWANLRLVTRAENLQNQSRPRRDNKSGFRGVTWFKPTRSWRATIKASGQQITLGYFASPEAAHSAYVEAKRRLHSAWNGAT